MGGGKASEVITCIPWSCGTSILSRKEGRKRERKEERKDERKEGKREEKMKERKKVYEKIFLKGVEKREGTKISGSYS